MFCDNGKSMEGKRGTEKGERKNVNKGGQNGKVMAREFAEKGNFQ